MAICVKPSEMVRTLFDVAWLEYLHVPFIGLLFSLGRQRDNSFSINGKQNHAHKDLAQLGKNLTMP
jgi:hypothetical protein